MTANTKSMFLLAMTLVTGFALGLFADATLVRGRRDRIEGMRRPPGFVAHMESVIQPHSDAQRDSIRPILESAGRRNQQAIREANLQLRAALDSMKTELAPILDSSQRDRLAREVEHMPDPFRPGGGRGRGRGGPPGGRRGGPPP
jgi:hypothetical protein